nr:hypothetical protein [Ningiella sp. W23]
MERVSGFFSNIFQDDIPSLGHGQALSNPDLPIKSGAIPMD